MLRSKVKLTHSFIRPCLKLVTICENLRAFSVSTYFILSMLVSVGRGLSIGCIFLFLLLLLLFLFGQKHGRREHKGQDILGSWNQIWCNMHKLDIYGLGASLWYIDVSSGYVPRPRIENRFWMNHSKVWIIQGCQTVTLSHQRATENSKCATRHVL